MVNFRSLKSKDGQSQPKSITTRKGRGASISNNLPKPVEEKTFGRKRKAQNVPILNFVLKEHEIYDDISYFTRMGISGRRGFSRK